ncbi:hypothetical protein RGUI_2994 [Rhodovulum sp. P5]|nr:hypothetical protein RGUI_2994 [Rhodovulum sp. P5]
MAQRLAGGLDLRRGRWSRGRGRGGLGLGRRLCGGLGRCLGFGRIFRARRVLWAGAVFAGVG